ncbi:hypothetical protein Slala03_08130 [Streptomyces lavendulae subsp. lavendulae]|nr:hypothetical protein Slala03_08130 [Streptomyces lavendulae subsp. lavendulae]
MAKANGCVPCVRMGGRTPGAGSGGKRPVQGWSWGGELSDHRMGEPGVLVQTHPFGGYRTDEDGWVAFGQPPPTAAPGSLSRPTVVGCACRARLPDALPAVMA